jgi:hypothetical protein
VFFNPRGGALGQGADPAVCERELGLCAVDVAEYSKEALDVFRRCDKLSKPQGTPDAPELRNPL